MNSLRTWLIVVLAVTTAGGALLAWKQSGELAELRAAAMNRTERADLQKRVWDLEKAKQEAKDRATTTSAPKEAPLAATADGTPRESDPRAPGRREPDPQLKAMRDLLNKPGVQGMITAQQKAAIDARYAALFRNLNLPADQTEKLKSLLAERTTTMLDVLSVASDQGVDPRDNPAGFRQLVASTQDEINRSIKSLLGDQGFAQLTRFEQTQPQRNIVNELQQRLSYSSTPLTSAQSDQLVQILATNPPPRPTPLNPSAAAPPAPGSVAAAPVRGVDVGGMFAGIIGGAVSPAGADIGRNLVTPAAVAQSQTVLSPPQVAALQQLQQQQQTAQQLRQLWNEATAPAAAATPPGTAVPVPAHKRDGKQ